MNYTEQDIKRIDDFQKYAQFICEQFDIEIELDSNKAETDGKLIKLPNILGLNAQELDVMYAVLLHETGHIKYSSFTEEDFSKLKSVHHASLANAIEDARIENLLIKEFAGAEEIFEELYSKHLVNKKILRRMFQIKTRSINLFTALGFYVHSKLVNCKTAPYSKLVSRVPYRKIKEFVLEKDIDTLLEQSQLKNWDDVIELTNKLYDMFIEKHKDTSTSLDFKTDVNFKKDTVKALADVVSKIEAMEKAVESETVKALEKTKEIDDFDVNHEKEYNDLDRQRRPLQEKIAKTNEDLVNKNAIEKLANAIKSNTEKLNNFSNELSQIEVDIEEMGNQIKSNTNAKGRTLTEKQKESLDKKMNTRNKQKDSINNKIKSIKDIEISNANELNGLKKKESQLSKEDLESSIEDMRNKVNAINSQEDLLNEKRNELTNQLNEIQSKIDAINNNAYNNVINQLYQLDNQSNSLGFDIDVLPKFEETAGWSAADEIQKEFDKKASEMTNTIVRNGGKMSAAKFGTNLRDLALYVDTTKEKVKNFDLTNLFKKKANTSRFPSFNNNDTQVIMALEDFDVMDTYGSLEKHTVLTTEYDTVEMKNGNANKLLVNSLSVEGKVFISQLKDVFIKRFKFAKKDKFKGGKEEGGLDVRNMWKLATNSGDDYFEINNPKKVNKMASTILIDISGSQDKEETEHGKKIKMVTLALSESLKAVHVKHEILGYHAPICDEMKSEDASHYYNRKSNRLETVVYKNFNQKDNLGIGNIEIELSDNSDGESIRIALKRLKKERAKTKSLFVLTDGKPFLSHSDVNILDEDLKLALRDAVKQKVKVYAIGFTPNGKLFYGDNYCYPQSYADVVSFFAKIEL